MLANRTPSLPRGVQILEDNALREALDELFERAVHRVETRLPDLQLRLVRDLKRIPSGTKLMGGGFIDHIESQAGLGVVRVYAGAGLAPDDLWCDGTERRTPNLACATPRGSTIGAWVACIQSNLEQWVSEVEVVSGPYTVTQVAGGHRRIDRIVTENEDDDANPGIIDPPSSSSSSSSSVSSSSVSSSSVSSSSAPSSSAPASSEPGSGGGSDPVSSSGSSSSSSSSSSEPGPIPCDECPCTGTELSITIEYTPTCEGDCASYGNGIITATGNGSDCIYTYEPDPDSGEWGITIQCNAPAGPGEPWLWSVNMQIDQTDILCAGTLEGENLFACADGKPTGTIEVPILSDGATECGTATVTIS